MNRGLAVPISYKLLAPVEEHTEENMKMANILGWCIELVSRQYNVRVLLPPYLLFEPFEYLTYNSFSYFRCKRFSWWQMISWMVPKPEEENNVGTKKTTLA